MLTLFPCEGPGAPHCWIDRNRTGVQNEDRTGEQRPAVDAP